jgi:hypothetical protein
MLATIEILTNNRQKIPSWKVDIVQNLALQNIAVPRKIHISGHFRLKHPIITENNLCNKLIF